MKTAAIFIDKWKLPIFKKTLKEKGYKFTILAGLTHDTLFLKVKTENLEVLKTVVKQMGDEAARSKIH